MKKSEQPKSGCPLFSLSEELFSEGLFAVDDGVLVAEFPKNLGIALLHHKDVEGVFLPAKERLEAG